MSNFSKLDLLSDKEAEITIAREISDRLSRELVIALVGPVGSGVSLAADIIADILTQKFHYKVCPTIKPSNIIKSELHRVNMAETPREPLDAYIDSMQSAGNALRLKFGGNYLAEKIVEKIYKFRHENSGFSGGIHMPGRRAYINRLS